MNVDYRKRNWTIINNAPGTAAPIPGFLAPFGFNSPLMVALTLLLAAICGVVGGYIGTSIIMKLGNKHSLNINKN